MRFLSKSVAVVSLFAVVMLVPALGMAGVMEVVPDDALAFVVVNDIVKTNVKISALAKQLEIPIPNLLETAKLMTGAVKGIDEKRPFGFALMPGEDADAEPQALIFIPTTDYKTLVGQLNPDEVTAKVATVIVAGETALVGSKAGYAIFSPPDAEDALKAALDSQQSVAKSSAALKSWIAKQDVAGVATPAAIKLAATKGIEGLQVAKEALEEFQDEAQLAPALAMFDVYETILESCGRELTHVAIAARVDKDSNLLIATKTLFTSGGSFAKAAGQITAPTNDPLASLPSGPFVFAGGGGVPDFLMAELMKMSMKILESSPAADGPITPAQTKRMMELSMESLKSVRSMSMKMGVFEPGKSIYSSMTGIMQVDDPQAYLDTSEKVAKEYAKLIKETGLPMMEYEISRTKVDGVSALKITMDMSGFFAGQDLPAEAAEAMKIFLGKDGKIIAYMAPVGKDKVAFAYTSTDNLKKVIAAANGGESLAGNKQVAKTMAMLPKGSQWAGLLSLQGLVQTGANIFATFTGGQAPPLPLFPDTPPLGFGVKLSAEGVEKNLALPIETIKAVKSYAGKIQAMFLGGFGG